MARKYLLYCPVKGKECRGEFWSEDRLYDIAVNDWTGVGQGWNNAEYVFALQGHKWPCIKRNLALISSQYDFYAFFDYDIEISTESVNRLFRIGAALELDLFQPALSSDSTSAYHELFVQTSSLARSTAFVEIMMPVFSKQALDACIHSFNQSESGYGLDIYWPHVLKGKNIGIIDAVVAKHAGPVQSHNWKLSNGLSPLQELETFLQSHSIGLNSSPRAAYCPRDCD